MKKLLMAKRFRGLLPIVIDVETGGFNSSTDALLEIAAVTLAIDKNNQFHKDQTFAYHVEPFQGSHIDPESLKVTGIDATYPLRFAIPEQQVLHNLFRQVKKCLEATQCHRAVLVGHNAWFDLAFLQAAVKRCAFQDVPFHSFTTFDTASLSALVLGETVLAKALRKAGIFFDVNQAHSAIYDAEKTAELFCFLVNRAMVLR